MMLSKATTIIITAGVCMNYANSNHCCIFLPCCYKIYCIEG